MGNRLEGNQAGNLACYRLALGDSQNAKYWARFGAYDRNIPKPMTQGSVNIPPRIMIGEQRWNDLEQFFDTVYGHAWGGNEIGSPLYEGSVYGGLAIACAVAPAQFKTLRRVFRTWTAFLAIRSAIVARPPAWRWRMGDKTEDMPARPGGRTVWTPPAGMRTHPWAIAGPSAPKILATVLDLPVVIGGKPFDPKGVAKTLADWKKGGTGLRMPRGMVHAVAQHRSRLRDELADVYNDVRTVVRGDHKAIRRLAQLIDSIRLRDPLDSYVVERGRNGAVFAAWTGRQTSVQKSFCVAAKHEGGKFDMLCPSRWKGRQDVIATPIKGRVEIDDHEVRATADVSGTMTRLRAPEVTVTFWPDRAPTIT